MRSSLTSASRFLLAISLVVLVGCDDDAQTCGPEAAPAELSATGTDVTLPYGTFEAGLNNDCPHADAPEGVVSMTIAAEQVGAATRRFFTLCIPRPDRLADGLALGVNQIPADPQQVQIIDAQGEGDGCTFSFDDTAPPTGTATAAGLCDNGANPAGFALTVDGSYTMKRTCGATVDTVTVTVNGTVAVTSTE
jgi:hypothetical protein